MTTIEKIEVDAPIEFFSDHASTAAADLKPFTAPGQVALIGGVVSRNDTPHMARSLSLHFAKDSAESKKSVCFVTEQPTSFIAGILEPAKVNTSAMWRKPITKHTTKETIINGAKGADTVIFWLPVHANSETILGYFEAAREIADSGAAVILVCAMKSTGAKNTTDPVQVMAFNLAGSVPAGIVDRAWVVVDHREAEALHSLKTMNALAPLADPNTTKGYLFTIEAGIPVFRFDSRSNNARGVIRQNFVDVKLRG